MNQNPFKKLYTITGEDGIVFSGYRMEYPKIPDFREQIGSTSNLDFVTTEKIKTKFWNRLSSGIKKVETTTVIPGSGTNMVIEKKISYLYKTDPE